MKKIFCFFVVFLTFCSQAQNEITIVFKDQETNQPIEDVAVTVLRSKEGLLSNKDGLVVLDLNRPSLLEFKHSSYKDKLVKSVLLKEKINVVLLEANTFDLEEVIMTRDHPQDILINLIKNSKAKLNIPANLKVYTREFFKKQDVYVFYNDGLLNFQIKGNDKKIETDILVEQNRSYGLLDEFDKDILGYNLNNLMSNYYQFKYLEEITESKHKKIYDFEVTNYKNNEYYNVIRVRPLRDSKGFLSEFRIVYDSRKKLIVEVSSFIPLDRAETNKTFPDLKAKKIYLQEFKTTYRFDALNYYLVNSQEKMGFHVTKNKQEVKYEINNYFVTTLFRKQLFQYTDAETFKDKTLLNKMNSIITDYWEDDSGLILTKTEEEIISNLVSEKYEVETEKKEVETEKKVD